jgi:hypothetical protein
VVLCVAGEGGATREHKTSFHAISRVIRSEGVLGLYNGLSAGLLRQATYSTTRLGVYQSLYDKFTGPDGKHPNLLMKLGMGKLQHHNTYIICVDDGALYSCTQRVGWIIFPHHSTNIMMECDVKKLALFSA